MFVYNVFMVNGRFRRNKRGTAGTWRLKALRLFFVVFTIIIIIRLFSLQILQASFYEALASGQHSFYQELFADRGSIFVKDWKGGGEYVVATNEPKAFVFADPRRIEKPEEVTDQLAVLLGYEIPPKEKVEEEVPQQGSIMDGLQDGEEQLSPDIEEETKVTEEPEENIYEQYETLLSRLSKKEDPYEPVARGVDQKTVDKLEELNIDGIDYVFEDARSYPEVGLGGHIFGFVRPGQEERASGQYGLEGYYNEFLSGENGFLDTETDATGRWIGVGAREFKPAVDGGDLVLTIDRTVQYIACKKLKEGVEKHQADGGSVVIIHPSTGRIIAMCGTPDFNPNAYRKAENIADYNNPAIFTAYESGSVFKPIAMAAALDVGVVTPTTLYNDLGEEKVDDYTIRNSDLKAHGLNTMTQVLEKSLNTGMIFVMRQMGQDTYKRYIEQFGFGQTTGIELDTESAGTIDALDKSSEIYFATASYGQGITVTPLQLTVAYAALANGGMLMKPYIVSEKRFSNGTVDIIKPKTVHQVISKKTATTIGAMLVSVIENGHGDKAKVPGFYTAGKTGTAQVAKSGGGGYIANQTMATFSGFGPVNEPVYAMTVMFDHPKTVGWAADTAAPTYGEIAEFLLQYFEVPPTRPLE